MSRALILSGRRGPERPVMTRDALLDLGERIIGMSSTSSTAVALMHTSRAITHLAGGEVVLADDGEELEIVIMMGSYDVYLTTDQIDMDVLRAMVARGDKVMRDRVEAADDLRVTHDVQDTYLPVQLWHESTVEAMRSARTTLLPAVVRPIEQQGLTASGMVGFFARTRAFVSRDVKAVYEETDSELSVRARTQDNTGSGWAGQAHRDWSQIDPAPLVSRAMDVAQRSRNPRAFEPGRRTVILTPEAVAQIFRYAAELFDGDATDLQDTPMWQSVFPGNKIGQQLFDARVELRSDPTDPEGGYAPFFSGGYANPVMTWVEHGRLRNLAYGNLNAMTHQKAYSDKALSLRMGGGPSSIEQMIAGCAEGVLINQLYGVDLLNRHTGMMTGTTRDGCFLVKDGKLGPPVKNFRFTDSPMFMLNSLVALGEARRAAFGYTPPGLHEDNYERRYPPLDWPRQPMIVPPMMVRDFNLSSLAEAV